MATAMNFIKKDRSKEIPKFITNKLSFGKLHNSSQTAMWPQPKDQAKITKPMKLSAIRYKHRDDDYNLSAIQLCFTGGYKTPFFESEETKGSGWEQKLIKIDATKNISAIAMKMSDDGWLRGLKIVSDEQEVLCDVTWCTYREDGKWVWKDLTDTEQIMGIAVDTVTETQYIRVAWVVGSEKQPAD